MNMTLSICLRIAICFGAATLSLHALSANALEQQRHAKISLIEQKRLFVAGEAVVVTPSEPLPVYGVTTSLCFTIGEPFKKDGAGFFGSNLRIKATLDHIFASDKNSRKYDLSQKLLSGEYKTISGHVHSIPGNISVSRQRIPEAPDLVQVQVCAKLAPRSSDPIVSITFTVPRSFEAQEVYWITSDSLRHKKRPLEANASTQIIRETKEAITLEAHPTIYKQGHVAVFDLSRPLQVSKGMPNICFAVGKPYFEGSTFEESISALHLAIKEGAPAIVMESEYITRSEVIKGHITNRRGDHLLLDTALYAVTGRTEPFEFDARQAFLCARANDANSTQEITSVHIQFLVLLRAKYVTWHHPFAVY